ncbi:MAG: methionyl-tRNA formyltransferase [Pseudomonadota bacterium]
MRLVFMGTPDFSVAALQALVEAGHEIAAVYTQPPRPAGRGKKDRLSPVAEVASELGLPVEWPKSLRDPKAQATFLDYAADVAVVVAYGLILPQAVLDAPRHGCINIHASLLPRWRGAAPIQRAIMAGDDQTGISIMQMEAGLDTGPVLLSRAIDIAIGETAGELHDRLSVLGAETIALALGDLENLTPTLQPETGVIYAEKIDKEEARIDWSRPAVEIARGINGLSPFPGAWSLVQGKRVKFLRAESVTEAVAGSGAPGAVISVAPDLTIACGDGAVRIREVQAEGRTRQSAREYLRGARLDVGEVLSAKD